MDCKENINDHSWILNDLSVSDVLYYRGADDLLPVLCYVVTKSGLPQLVSECHAVERFIHEG